MSDGNKFDVTAYAHQRQQNRLPLEEMGNVLLDAMQGTLICLDNHNIIIDASKTIKNYFGFEQAEIVGLSILLLIEDSERDLFSKFLSSSSQLYDICCVRMIMAVTNEYRQVKVHRKKKFSHDNVDVHSTTNRYSSSIGTILVLTLDDSSYIDITLFDVYKEEFYTKMNLIGEIIFEDHRGAVITGYLPHEIVSQSIFNFVYHDDRLVKLHALWKCVTTGASKLQWRLNARDGSLVFLHTEYKLIANHQNQDTIVARNEVLDPIQQSQFDELQAAWRHQCAADIKGNSSSFKLISSSDIDSSSSSSSSSSASISTGDCRIYVPSLNMCFSTNKLQSLKVVGNIFDVSKLARPLTIQDYISILINNDKYLDNELVNIINNLPSLVLRYKRLNNNDNQTMNDIDISDITMDEKLPSDFSSSSLTNSSLAKKDNSDSIVRGILNNSMKYNHEKQPVDSSSPTLVRILNGNTVQNDNTKMPTSQINSSKSNQIPLNSETIQQQHIDFIKKYTSAKEKLEAQLDIARKQEIANGGQASDVMKRNTILNKLSQLENIKNKHLARTLELRRQTQQMATSVIGNNIEQKDLLNGLFNSSSPKSIGYIPMDTNSPTNISSLYNSPSPTFYPSGYQHQQNSSPVYRASPLQFDSGQNSTSFHDLHTRVKTPVYDEFLMSSSPSSYIPVNNPSLSVHSYMNVSFQGATNNSTPMKSSSFNNHHHHHHHHHHHNTTYPY
ncbi:unnamed protein product [Rotaria sordida]|uniref:PAS domain-containing protein n=2 Tax=Rotaria sordida TaxID=392033 RepID=A0A814EMM1_9BILA|nr:unnamed protein product [Rotaria sordida]